MASAEQWHSESNVGFSGPPLRAALWRSPANCGRSALRPIPVVNRLRVGNLRRGLAWPDFKRLRGYVEMDRRAFIGRVTGSLITAPLAAEAQQATKVPRIGLLAANLAGNPRRATPFSFQA